MATDAPPDSPPPTRPTSQAPGIRASALQRNFDQAIAHTLKTCSYPNFAACFPTPAQYVPEALTGLHREFIAKLDEVCRSEFAALLADRDVIPSLNNLDNLISEARARMERAKEDGSDAALPTPPHLLPPQALLDAHLAPFLAQQTESLTTQLEATREDNAALSMEVEGQRREIEALIAGLEHVVADLEGAARALEGEQMDGVEEVLAEAAGAAMAVSSGAKT